MAHYNPLAFQSIAIDQLVDTFKKLWRNGPEGAELVFKSPTGSGKTFMVTHFVDELNRQPDWQEDVAYVWITFSDDLAMQSKQKFEDYFFPNISNRLLTIDDFEKGKLDSKDILFINWQKLVSRKAESRRLRRPDDENYRKESGFYFEDVVEQTHAEKREIVMIIDESHKNVTEASMRDVIMPISPRVIVKVSATPEKEPTAGDVSHFRAGFVEVERKDVVEAGLIKREIVSQTEDDLNLYQQIDHDKLLLELAMEKRDQVAEEWKRLGAKVNPLVLIQLPNDEKNLRDTNVKKKEQVVTEYLASKGVTRDRIACWFDGRRENMDGITEPDNKVEYMLFKYAAGTGWDCPRAHILVMYREIQSNTFKTQTLGRILRNPLPGNTLDDYPTLYTGYLFTNYQRNEVQNPKDGTQNKPKTEISEMRSSVKTSLMAPLIAENVLAAVEKDIPEEKRKGIGAAIVQKVNEISKEISEISVNEKDELKKATKIDEVKGRLVEAVKEQLSPYVHDKETELHIAQKANTQADKCVDVLAKDKEELFVLDPCLKSDYITRADYGDLGKATELQLSVRFSFDKFFQVKGNEIDRESQREILRSRGVDPEPTLEQDVIVNARFKSDVDDSENELGGTVKFEMSDNDVEKEFTLYCYDLLAEQTDETKVGNVARSWGAFKGAIVSWYGYRLSVAYNENVDFYRVVVKDLHRNERSVFRQAVKMALRDYKDNLKRQLEERKARALQEEAMPFVIKTRMAYTDDYKAFEGPCDLSVAKPFRLPERYNGRENEVRFIEYLQSNYEKIEWWFKNGDSGKDYLGFRYTDSVSGKDRLFYPDWIVLMKDGRIGIFDTKGGMTAASPETKDKAEALAGRLARLNRESKRHGYFGGIVVWRGGEWLYNDSEVYDLNVASEKWKRLQF